MPIALSQATDLSPDSVIERRVPTLKLKTENWYNQMLV
jgi:hypothetical protein